MEPTAVAEIAISPSFRRIFEAEFGYVCRALRRLGVVPGDVEDVAQEVFITVHDQMSAYEPDRPLKPWLFSFALRFATNYRRLARHRTRSAEDADEQPVSGHDGKTAARDLVLRALEQLEFERRVVFVMHDLEGFGAPELATELKTPLNTVYSRLRLAREDFREAVTELQRGGSAS